MNKEEEIKDSVEFCKDIYAYYELSEKASESFSQSSFSSDEITETEAAKEEEEMTMRKSLFREIRNMVICIVFAFLTAKLLSSYVVQMTEVHGESMETTLSEGDRLFVEKLGYRIDKVKRFDVIVFTKDGEVNLIKRVIGLPGEKVEIIEGKIFINGEELKEEYGLDPINPNTEPIAIQLKEEEYFVLGDNRLVSVDSRYPSVGAVKKEEIIGRAFFRVYPFDEIGWMRDKEENESSLGGCR